MPGDVYLLCSDGLNDMVEDEEIALTLQALSANLELAATQLVQTANDSGGRTTCRWCWCAFRANIRRRAAGGRACCNG
jgi:hypothetical protein